jgi:hypothetical protein
MMLGLRLRSRLAFAACAALLVSASGSALAQASAQDSAAAQSLYNEGRKLMSADKYGDACPKLEESQRLDPQQVTEFYLAECYEKAGRTASAWSTFLDLASLAKRAGRADREKVARDRAAALEPKLTKLTIDVPAEARVQGLVVKRDGEVVREGQWGAPVAVDPGKHAIEASAPGKKTWSTSQEVSGAGAAATVKVEVLADEPGGGLPVQPVGGEKKSSSLKTVGLVVAGVGVVGLGVGAYFGLSAISKNSDANNGHCDSSSNLCDAQGVQMRSDAVSAGNTSTIAFIAGGVLTAAGLGLWIFAPSSSVQAGPTVGSGGAGMALRGAF